MSKGKKKIDVVQIIRLAVQVAFFILLPALFVDAFDGIKGLVTGLIHNTFDLAVQLPQLIAALAVIPVTVMFGRFFCGWLCAFGAFGDFIHRVFGRFVKFKINGKLDSRLKSIKFILLAFLVVAGWVLGSKVFAAANPWDAFAMLFTVGKPTDFVFVLAHLAPALILLVVITAGSVFVERFFCRYLCPLGAVFSILSRLRIIKISKPSAKCGKCRICTGSCAMGIPMYQKDTVASGECIACMKCVAACPRKNVSVIAAGGDIRPVAAGALAVAVMAGVYLGGDKIISSAQAAEGSLAMELQATTQPSQTADAAAQPASVSSSATYDSKTTAPAASAAAATPEPTATAQPAHVYKDGTYSGLGRGFRGATTTVSVTISSDKITNLKVISYGDDRQFFQAAYPVVTKEILKAQSPQVDAVSGATYSSNGIMSAVADALNQAKI